MAVWVVRAGRHGEYEQKFIQDQKVWVTWDGLDVDLSTLPARADLTQAMVERHPDAKPNAIRNWVGQV